MINLVILIYKQMLKFTIMIQINLLVLLLTILIGNSKEKLFNSGFNTKLLANIKNINYEAKNVEPYKESTTSEIYGALGY